jgi:formylglycine-generating enzyme required for sulfatase activity
VLTPEDANIDGYVVPRPGQRKHVWVGQTTPVDRYPPNPWGLYDMHGNLRQWCADWYGPYPDGPVTDPQGPPYAEERVLRGGSWAREAAESRSAARHHAPKNVRSDFNGCRIVLRPD